MTKIQFRESIKMAGLTQANIAQLFGYNARSVRRWILGERKVPPAVMLLLELLRTRKITILDIEQIWVRHATRQQKEAKHEYARSVKPIPAD